MSDGCVSAKFGPPDSDGFRTVSLSTRKAGEVMRVSVHLERFRQSVAVQEYTSDEMDGLRTAAIIAASRTDSTLRNPDAVLAVMLDVLIPNFLVDQSHKIFPVMACEALELVMNACIKFAVNASVQWNNAPRLYGSEEARKLLKPLNETITKELLEVESGRPSELRQRLQDIREVVTRLLNNEQIASTEEATPDQVIEGLTQYGLDARSVKDWPNTCNLTWDELIRASQWEDVKKAQIPPEILDALRKQFDIGETGEN